MRLASMASTALSAMTPKVAKPSRTPTKPAKRAGRVQDKARQGSSFRAGIHDCDHGSRRYKLFTPGLAADAKPPPLLVMLHGCGQTPDDFAKGTRMNALAGEFGFIVVYPAQPRDAHPNRCWNWFGRDDQARGSGEPALLASLTRHIVDRHGADPGRVYVAGLSAGASAALILAGAYPEIFAAVGAHSGLPAGAAQDQASALLAMQRGNPGRRLEHPMPTIIFHGSRDHVVHPRNGRLAAIRAREPYASLRATEFAGQIPNGHRYVRTVHRIGSGRPLVEHWSVAGSGHAWSGGSSAGRFTDPKGPDASREMVRFFLRHSLPARQRAALAARLATAQDEH
ncbi:PHB depolymerase family esterase [Paracoccus sp. SSJ]|uniref:extracellular catalytic domain type 1 short-chain-length polyhydroxyalkanoate depolymerase n=1 Tax=Paracoccus sp. SSJ TaxID=3050636 RepID=UPI00254AC84D|nr:PHB depolymerase family esterase [Paracoccus sp. SSJ]MDK8871020.1 PHB depolymerase family esterase [Paracoccus sp. SSJ]